MDRNRERGFAEAAPIFQRSEPTPSGQAREVQASVAKAHFSQLLDEVERGATIIILRHGRPVARIVPDPEHRRAEIDKAIEEMRRLAKERTERFGPVSVEDIISSIHEGHKY
jgi:prevent-host-death family protein